MKGPFHQNVSKQLEPQDKKRKLQPEVITLGDEQTNVQDGMEEEEDEQRQKEHYYINQCLQLQDKIEELEKMLRSNKYYTTELKIENDKSAKKLIEKNEEIRALKAQIKDENEIANERQKALELELKSYKTTDITQKYKIEDLEKEKRDLKNRCEDLEVEAQQLSLNNCNLGKANETLKEQALQKEAENEEFLDVLEDEAKVVWDELEAEQHKNKILSQKLKQEQYAVSKAEKSIKEKIDRIEELLGHRLDLTKELDSLEKKLKEAEDVIDSCREEEVNKYRKDLVAGKMIEPDIEDQIIHILEALEVKSNGAFTLKGFQEDLQHQKEAQIEERKKKLAAGRNLGEVVIGIENCENCKTNLQGKLMEFLNRQRTN